MFPDFDPDHQPLLLHYLLECDSKTVICQGGRRAIKTFSISELFIIRSIINHNQIRIIIGWDMPHMKRGCIADMLRIFALYPEAQKQLKSYNQQETKFYFRSGSTIQFASFANEQDAKMTDIQDFYMNECNFVKNGFGIFNQMQMQCKGQGFLDYNSTSPFWVHAKLIGRPDVRLFINDHRSNPFLSEGQHEQIETQYPHGSELWKVYARGMTGHMEGAIYKNWKVIKEWPQGIEEVIWGLDYGYTIGMTALVKVGVIDRRRLAVLLCCYKPGLTAEQIKLLLYTSGYISGQRIYADHDEDKKKELGMIGIGIRMAEKGEKSEWNGIMKCQEFEVEYVYDEFIETEKSSYQWESVQSLETGEDILTQSVKDTKKYHFMAAFRMAVFTYFNKRKGFTL
jgi:phage terminase large subunit